MHVPEDRDGDAYFVPSRAWRRADGKVLYVGLIHHADENGDRCRFEAARRVLPGFGIAGERDWVAMTRAGCLACCKPLPRDGTLGRQIAGRRSG